MPLPDATELRVQAVAKASMRMCIYMYGLGIETKMDGSLLYAGTFKVPPYYQSIRHVPGLAQKEGGQGSRYCVGGPHRGRSSSFSGRELQLTRQG